MLRTERIRYFQLHNDGGYIAEMAVKYRAAGTSDDWKTETWDENLKKGSDAKTIDAGKHGDTVLFATGTEIMLHLHVIAGDSKDAFDTFIYDSSSTLMARYVSCGGAQSTELGFEYITDHSA
jgi:hypothetical protein